MYTISNIIEDVQRGITVNNMVENEFSYRIIFFVNDCGKGTKHYVDTTYENLRQSLENIIRENLTTANTVVIATITVRKYGEAISLLSKSYSFSLSGYFTEICGEKRERVNSGYGRRRVNWC